MTTKYELEIDSDSGREKLATVLKTVSKVLVFIGKPLFLIVYLLSIVGIVIIHITGFILTTSISFLYDLSKGVKSKITESKILKNKGTIFTSKPRLLKNRIAGPKAIRITQRESLMWKTQVFFLALQKIVARSLKFTKVEILKIDLTKVVRLLVLKLKLASLHYLYKLPKRKSTKILKPRPALLGLRRVKILAFACLTIFISISTSVFLFWQLILKDLPSPQELTLRKLPVSTKIYDRNGILLYTIYKDENRTPVKLTDIPIQVKSATIAAEDSEFYSHPGFSFKGIVRAVYKDLREGKITGGSTITQQLVKNALLTPEKTLTRKLKEITLSIMVETTYTKDQILEMYLNEAPYGGTAYGIQEAARMYFNKDVKDLSLAQAAFLAGLPKSPTYYSPYGSHSEAAIARQKEVLNLMEQDSFITSKQNSDALASELSFSQPKLDIKAPHFVFFVRQALEDKYGKDLIDSGGLSITTTLDYGIQQLAEEVVKQEVDKLSDLNVTNGSALVLSPQTGEILAMVGSKDFYDTKIDGNVNVTTMERQPGSSIKVINYAYALSNGFSPATLIPDTPVTFTLDGQPPYTPKDYDGTFRGYMSLRDAFAQSRNIPAVRVLASYGLPNMIDMGRKMGITTWNNPNSYGLSLTLGGGGVKLLDLARAYATIANYGKRPDLTTILKIDDYKENTFEEFTCPTYDQLKYQEEKVEPEKGITLGIEKVSAASESALIPANQRANSCQGQQVVDPRVAFMITDILKDNSARSPAFGSNSLLNITGHNEVAVKTGTSNDLRDNLAIGYTQKYLVAVWVGNSDNSPMNRIASGITGATPIFNKIMSALLAREKSLDWQIPDKLVQLPICPFTGSLACDSCPARMEWFLEENKPQVSCSSTWSQEQIVAENSDTNQPSPTITPGEEEVDINNANFEKYLHKQFSLNGHGNKQFESLNL